MISGRVARFLLLIAALLVMGSSCFPGSDQADLGPGRVVYPLPAHFAGTGSMSMTFDDHSADGPKTCSLDGTAKADIDAKGALTMVVVVPGRPALDWNGNCTDEQPDEQTGGIARASNVNIPDPFAFASCNDGGMKADGKGSFYQPSPGKLGLDWIAAVVTCYNQDGTPDFTLHANVGLVP